MNVLQVLKSGTALKGKDLDVPGEINFLLDVDGFQKIVFLHAGITLGIFDALAAGSKTVRKLAKEKALHESVLRPLTHALAGLGYLARRGGTYSLSHFSAIYLVRNNKEYIGDYIRIFTDTWDAWMKLPLLAKTGKPIPGMGLKGNRGQSILRYYAAANEVVKQAAGQLLDRIDLGKVQRVICGEVGLTFLQELLKRKPDVEYTLASLKEHARFYPQLLKRFPLPTPPAQFVYSDRGNALKDSWGGSGKYDLVFLYRKLAFYDYGEQFIKKSYQVLIPGGMVVVCEPTTDSLLHFMRWILDAIQLMDYMVGGSQAPALMSSEEIAEKLTRAGFKKARVIPAMYGVFNFVVGRK